MLPKSKILQWYSTRILYCLHSRPSAPEPVGVWLVPQAATHAPLLRNCKWPQPATNEAVKFSIPTRIHSSTRVTRWIQNQPSHCPVYPHVPGQNKS